MVIEYDSDGYPTDESLQRLIDRLEALVREGKIEGAETLFYLALTENRYRHANYVGPDRVDIRGEATDVWAYHTSGWSGNEAIIGALEKWLLFDYYLERYDSGGHYYFRLPDRELLKQMLEKLSEK